MRISTYEISPGIGRYCSAIFDDNGHGILHAFGNNYETAEKNLVQLMYNCKRALKLLETLQPLSESVTIRDHGWAEDFTESQELLEECRKLGGVK